MSVVTQIGDASGLRVEAPHHQRLEGKWILKCIVFTPLLWLAGMLSLTISGMVLLGFLRRCCWKEMKDPAVGGWLIVSAAQAASTVINWAGTDEHIGTLLYRVLSAPVSGWAIIAALIAIGKYTHVEVQKLGRSVALLGVYLLCLGIPLLLIGMHLGISSLEWLTPVGHLVPANLPAAQFQFTAQFLVEDNVLGNTIPRLVLFYPWPTCLGFAGAAILFICVAQKRSFLSVFGALGGAFALAASMSRAAVLATIVALSLSTVIRLMGRRVGLVLAIGTGMSAGFTFCCVASGTGPVEFVMECKNAVAGLREDSSVGRRELYEETYKRIEKAPFIGYGWQGEILEDTIPLPIGSHSSIYGLLYTGGILTLAPFIFTAVILTCRLLQRAINGTSIERAALCIWVVLGVMSYGECIFSFSVPVFFAFIWMGFCLRGECTTRISERKTIVTRQPAG